MSTAIDGGCRLHTQPLDRDKNHWPFDTTCLTLFAVFGLATSPCKVWMRLARTMLRPSHHVLHEYHRLGFIIVLIRHWSLLGNATWGYCLGLLGVLSGVSLPHPLSETRFSRLRGIPFGESITFWCFSRTGQAPTGPLITGAIPNHRTNNRHQDHQRDHQRDHPRNHQPNR